jgi:hypothetical protein
MYPFKLVSNRLIECCDDIAQFVDMPEFIFVLGMTILLISLVLLRLRR